MRQSLLSRCVLAGVFCAALSLPAYAIDGTWTGANSDEWTDATNWTSDPNVPDGTATFTSTGNTAVANNGSPLAIGTVDFTLTAQSYIFGINSAFVLTGTGVVNSSGNAQNFIIADAVVFQNGSTARSGTGAVNYLNGGFIYFQNTSTAGTANITNNGIVQFYDTSSAGGSSYTNNILTDFFDSSRAGTAAIVNNGTLTFNNTSSADQATITGAGSVQFNNAADAGSATLDLQNGLLDFYSFSSAGNATIGSTNLAVPMTTSFRDSSTGGNATINVLSGGSTLDFYNTSSAGNATITTEQGTTNFRDSSNAGTATVINQNGGTTQFNSTSSASTANISNAAGSSTTFADSSTAAGATITNNGGSTVFSDNSSGGAANITNLSGTTTFSGSSNAGTATITNSAAGNMYFSGAADAAAARVFNNATGIIDISQATAGTSIGSVEGAGNIYLGSKTLTLGNTNLPALISGVIADRGIGGGVGGGLTKRGDGVLTLSGNSTYTGATNINAGTLVVDGSLLSSVIVRNGGTLAGVGTTGGITANSGGVVSPGTSGIATMNSSGNVAFNAGSFYRVEVNAAGQNDRIDALGTANLTGGTVQVQAAAGSYTPSTVYTILHANAGVAGQFSSATSDFAFLRPTLTYTAFDVLLTLNLGSFGAAGQTPNQRAVGGALDASAPGSALVQAMLTLTEAQASQALDALSGEVHASTQTVLAADAGYMRDAVLGRLRSAGYSGSGGTAALGAGGPATAYAAQRDPHAAFANADPVARPWTLWAQGFGSWGTINSDGNAAGMRRNIGGTFGGADMLIGASSRLGVAAGYSQSNANIGARQSSSRIDSAHLAAYGGTAFGAFKLRGGAGFTWSEIDTDRTINFFGFNEHASAGYRAGTAQVFGEIGYGFNAGRAAFEPFAGLAWQNVHTSAFTETGGIAALNGASNRFDGGSSTLGLRAASVLPLANGMALVPRATLAWQHAFQTTPDARLSFASTGAGFTVSGVPLARDMLLTEASLDLQINARTAVGVGFVGRFSADTTDAGVTGKLSVQFN